MLRGSTGPRVVSTHQVMEPDLGAESVQLAGPLLDGLLGAGGPSRPAFLEQHCSMTARPPETWTFSSSLTLTLWPDYFPVV